MANVIEIVVTSKDRSGDGFDAAEKKAGKFGGALERVRGVAVAAAAGIAVGAVAVGTEMVKLGNRMDELDTKARVVFEGELPRVQAWADANAKAFGVSSREVVGMAANLADLLKPMGFTATQATDMSTKMLDLSGALAKWSGGTRSAAEVSEILSAAMLGERDALQGLGISISAAEIEASLLAKGQQELTGQARAQAEAIATQELVLAKSTDAQKAWAEGGKQAAETQHAMSSSVATLKEKLATALAPALAVVVDLLTKLAGWAAENPTLLLALAAVVGGALVVAFTAWAISATSAALATIAATWPILAIIAAIALLVGAIIWLVKHWDLVSRIGSRMWDGFIAGAKAAVNAVIWAINGIIMGINGLIRGLNAVNPFGDIPFIPHVPRLARGGIAGGMALVGEAGPELVRLPHGSSVIPSGTSRGMLASSGTTGRVVLELRFGDSPWDEVMMEVFRNAVRDQGGDVQVVLGQ